jgi:hypothetical protein
MANIQREARGRLKSAKRPIDRAETVIFFLLFDCAARGVGHWSDRAVSRFIVANCAPLCHKPSLHRPADQGLPWRCLCWLFRFGNNLALSTL